MSEMTTTPDPTPLTAAERETLSDIAQAAQGEAILWARACALWFPRLLAALAQAEGERNAARMDTEAAREERNRARLEARREWATKLESVTRENLRLKAALDRIETVATLNCGCPDCARVVSLAVQAQPSPAGSPRAALTPPAAPDFDPLTQDPALTGIVFNSDPTEPVEGEWDV